MKTITWNNDVAQIESIPTIGERVNASEYGEAIVRGVYHNSRGNYITLEIAEGMTGMVFTSLLEVI